MKCFVFKRIDDLTRHWHSEGGLVVFAENKEQAKQMLEGQERAYQAYRNQDYHERDHKKEPQHVHPDAVDFEEADVICKVQDDVDPQVFVMPDSGCC